MIQIYYYSQNDNSIELTDTQSGKSAVAIVWEGFIMEKRNLFDSIDRLSIQELISCFELESKSYQKGSTILEYDAGRPSILAVLCSGSARLEMADASGDLFLMDLYEKNDIMGDLFTLPIPNLHYTVTASSECSVLLLDYRKLLSPQDTLKHEHAQLLNNLMNMIAQKSQQLSMHLSILFQPTTRDKLLGYLKFIHSLNPEEEEFIIPVSLSSLAEYLHVDRASMMRTLQLMKRDGLIESKARKFRLLDASPQIFVQETDHGIPSKESRKSEGAFIHAYKHEKK